MTISSLHDANQRFFAVFSQIKSPGSRFSRHKADCYRVQGRSKGRRALIPSLIHVGAVRAAIHHFFVTVRGSQAHAPPFAVLIGDAPHGQEIGIGIVFGEFYRDCVRQRRKLARLSRSQQGPVGGNLDTGFPTLYKAVNLKIVVLGVVAPLPGCGAREECFQAVSDTFWNSLEAQRLCTGSVNRRGDGWVHLWVGAVDDTTAGWCPAVV